MTIRFCPTSLSLLLLVLLTACSSSPTQPVRAPVEETDLTPVTDTVESEQIDPQTGFWKEPSERSLADVMTLSRSMPTYQPAVALEVVRSLESIRSSDLKTMIESQLYDPEFTEWLELALQLRTVMIDGSPVAGAGQYWQDYHYGHPVTRAEFIALASDYKSHFPAPSRVAVLLPDEGGLAAAAMAIRDGILRAYLDNPGNSALRFYSSGTNSESAMAAYIQARDEGADQIIGPLRLESTQAISELDDLSVPVLLLNRTDHEQPGTDGHTDLVTSMSLSQADEAASIAKNALAHDQSRAIVIVPDSAWGKRIEDAFITPFIQNGGQVSASAEYERSTSDHSTMLTKLLKIDESRQRKVRLQTQIGAPLTFEPSRRDDFDFIFMAASPQEGRELKPLLRFHDAGEVPVYSIGRIYSGLRETSRDQDLNGIVFTAVNWQLDKANAERPLPGSVRDGAFGRLYALGQDAWRLLPWLPLMKKDTDLWYSGEIGKLKIEAGGQIYRQPAWAQFSGGQPTPYQWPHHF